MKLSKPRFSIGSMLLATAVIALLPAYYYANAKASFLADQNERLEKETGSIEIDDPNRFYVRELRCSSELTWVYRIHTPGDRIWVKAGIFTDAEPTIDNVTLEGKEYLVLDRHSELTIRLVKKDDGKINFRFSFHYLGGGGGRLELPLPVHIDFAANMASWDHYKKAARMIEESPISRHGDVRSFATDEFIPLMVIDGEGVDADKKVVLFLEFRKPIVHIRER